MGAEVEKTAFSSRDLPAHLGENAKFDLWQDIHVAQIWSVEYTTSDKLPFEADIEATSIGSLVIGQMAGTIKTATRVTAISRKIKTIAICCWSIRRRQISPADNSGAIMPSDGARPRWFLRPSR